MKPQPYLFSFTSASLRVHDSVKLAELMSQHQDWATVRDTAVHDNLLQQRTQRSSKTLITELGLRLQQLTPEERNTLLGAPTEGQAQLLWAATCRRYRLIRQFTQDVVCHKYRLLDYQLPKHSFDVFFNDLASVNQQLDKIADSTRTKARQIIFQMMREVRILGEASGIQPVLILPTLLEYFRENTPETLSVFPGRHLT